MCAFGILLWLRIDWGFEEWLHEAYFYNFWHGVYFLLSGETILTTRLCSNTLNLDRRYRYKIQVLYLKNHKMYL